MSNSTTSTANVFIDLATFSELDAFLYGGDRAITWFTAAVQKANWFSLIPISLRHTGTVDFGQKNLSASINRSGDYVLHVWFRCQIPKLRLYSDGTIFTDASIRWTRNLMHNLFDRIWLTANELTIQEFDSYWLDVNYQFRIPAEKRIGYKNMIGQIHSMNRLDGGVPPAGGAGIDGVRPSTGTGTPAANLILGNGGYFTLVIPFFFGEDSGLAFPVAAVPFNDLKVNYNIRDWRDLIVVYPGTAVAGAPGTRVASIEDVRLSDQYTAQPRLLDPQTYSHYVVVHNDERVKMGDGPRDMLVHQTQMTQYAPFKDVTTRSSYDLRLSHSIVLVAFMAQNTTVRGDWSNYTTEIGKSGYSPLSQSTLVYESTVRFAMGSDYYSLLAPFLFSDAVPDETGYHMYTYALKPWAAVKPSGSTNYSKLANVSLQHDMSTAAQLAASALLPDGTTAITYPNTAGVLANLNATFRHICIARNHNIVRVANGSIGFPSL